jgi:Recombination endonuclease VII
MMKTIKTRGPKPHAHCKRGHLFTEENSKQLYNANGTKNGRLCLECNRLRHNNYYEKDSESRKERVRKHREAHPDTIRNTVLKKKYGITLEQYNLLLSEQDGKCFLCKTADPGRIEQKVFCVDHCHRTNTVRRLLCMTCNLALGAAKDDPALLRKMADYIESYQQEKGGKL